MSAAPTIPGASLIDRARQLPRQLAELYGQRIWQFSFDEETGVRVKVYAFLRVISITLTGLQEIKIFSRAAALSYSSLLGIGPLIAIGLLVAGTVLNSGDNTKAAVEKLNAAFSYVAPQLADANLSVELTKLLESFTEGARSATLGVAGATMLIVIVIQLFISIEESFNSIWGVRRGRPLFMRIVMYWALVTLGAVIALLALSLLSGTMLAQRFQYLPWGAELYAALKWSGPMIAFFTLTLLLSCFYRFIPNTSVRWLPCFVGAVIVVLLLFANNYLAFFYVNSVLRAKTLFGSLSLIPVLMGGLYIFWLIVLLGGQVTYAVQNVHFRASRTAWEELNQHSREGISLLVLVLIGRRFKRCEPACTATLLSNAVRLPTQLLNESINRLIDLGYVTTTPPAAHESSVDHRYQPARPLTHITLREFRDRFARLGSAPGGERLDSVDPVLRAFRDRVNRGLADSLGDTTIDRMIDELPADSAPRPAPAEAGK